MEVFVARQPIFDRKREVVAYELLFRSDAAATSYSATDSAEATTNVIANSLLSIGIGQMIGDKKAFINFDKAVLLGGLHAILPPEALVVELLETIEADAEVLAACANLSQQGYTIALDDYIPQHMEPLAKYANIIKVDMRSLDKAEQTRLLATYKPRGIAMLAEKVETAEEFEWALGAGYDYFQGYFFARPSTLRARQMPSTKLACLRLLSMVQQPDLDFVALEKLISSDVSFAFKLMRFANSALFARSGDVQSIQHALVITGEKGIRHWAVLAALQVMAKDKPAELVVYSLIRARFCERLVQIGGDSRAHLGFLMGLFSLLDGLLDLPIEEALATMKLCPEVSRAILGTAGEGDLFRNVLELARAFEAAQWDVVIESAARLRIERSMVGELYASATLWSQQVLRATARMTDTRKHGRRALAGTMQVLLDPGSGRERILNARVLNVSKMGLQIQVGEQLSTRTYVSCNDTKLGISGRGCVRYCTHSKGKYLVGLEFSGGTGWKDPLK